MGYNPITPLSDADKSAIKSEYQQALTDLQTIQGYTNPTNSQVVAAVKRLAAIQEKTLKFMARYINA